MCNPFGFYVSALLFAVCVVNRVALEQYKNDPKSGTPSVVMSRDIFFRCRIDGHEFSPDTTLTITHIERVGVVSKEECIRYLKNILQNSQLESFSAEVKVCRVSEQQVSSTDMYFTVVSYIIIL
jgi:hypothetical protein